MSGRAAREPLGRVGVEERRALRGHYRELAAETLAGKENLVSGGAGLQQLLHKVDALHSKAARPREHAVDAEVFAQLAACGLQMIRQGAAANEGRRPADLVRAVRATFVTDPGFAAYADEDSSAFDWCTLGAAVSGLFKTAPGVGCMLGPLAAQARVRKAVVRQPKRAVEAVTRPEELEQIEENDKQETDRNYENMWRQLKRVGFGQAVPLIKLVCSHRSFSQTVENIFTLSFLVRDQRVQLLSSVEGGLSVQPVSDEHRAAAQQRGAARPQQFMMSFTMRDWDAMKQLVAAPDCIMPDRQGRQATKPARAAAAADDDEEEEDDGVETAAAAAGQQRRRQQQPSAKRARRG